MNERSFIMADLANPGQSVAQKGRQMVGWASPGNALTIPTGQGIYPRHAPSDIDNVSSYSWLRAAVPSFTEISQVIVFVLASSMLVPSL